ncbi:hypothetical protein HOU00_gp039 [Caulobacter phage CcrPW]|uniref:Uncharacterized protein n=1 Tax=Caulobacter phage CcrPW TaxID=2283271 RepID=A0A385ECW2_9CAUD|nr:hypothetical protein HOU00_gp039 [Caulobacter phage CcrPW]AXQ68578.1 hypothetical protein CcrPW_gp039 [Caulobacter phage CcrPW]
MPTLSYFTHRMVVQWLRGIPTTPPTGLFVGALTQAPNADGSGVIEPSGNGYARRPITLTEAVVSAGVTTTQNVADTIFPTAQGNAWPQVTYLGVFNQTGDLLAYGPLAAPRAVGVGDSLAFGAGTIQLRLK